MRVASLGGFLWVENSIHHPSLDVMPRLLITVHGVQYLLVELL